MTISLTTPEWLQIFLLTRLACVLYHSFVNMEQFPGIPQEYIPYTAEAAREAIWQNQRQETDSDISNEELRKLRLDSLPVVDRLILLGLDGIRPLVTRVRSIITRLTIQMSTWEVAQIRNLGIF